MISETSRQTRYFAVYQKHAHYFDGASQVYPDGFLRKRSFKTRYEAEHFVTREKRGNWSHSYEIQEEIETQWHTVKDGSAWNPLEAWDAVSKLYRFWHLAERLHAKVIDRLYNHYGARFPDTPEYLYRERMIEVWKERAFAAYEAFMQKADEEEYKPQLDIRRIA